VTFRKKYRFQGLPALDFRACPLALARSSGVIESPNRVLHGPYRHRRIAAQRIGTPGIGGLVAVDRVPGGKQQSERQPIEGRFAILVPEIL
jgi:hypothetical protein